MWWVLLLVALALVGAGWGAISYSHKLRRRTGLPEGRLVYSDTRYGDWQTAPKPLYSARYRLVGKPDYLVKTRQGIIPVEVKSSPAPDVPYWGHILQLASYCLLVEETLGHTPSHGLLKYADALYEVDFTGELRRELLTTLDELRAGWGAEEVPRSHNQPGKCAACSYRYRCSERLDY